MKFSTVLILGLIGLILFGVFYDNKRAQHPAIGTPSSLVAPSTPSSVVIPSAPSTPTVPTSSVGPSSPSLLATVQSILKSASNSLRPSSAASDASPSSGTAESVRTEELLIARGTILQKTETGLLIECVPPVIDNSGTLGATSTEASAHQARTAMQQEEKQFGPLASVDHGILQPTHLDINPWAADKYLRGVVLLLGYPEDATHFGGAVKVVVAPVSPANWKGAMYQTFTTVFNAPPAPPNSWMWNSRAGTALESR